jgi:VanZ family protein
MPIRRRSFWTALLFALALVAGVLAVVPQPPPTLDTGWDKLNHVLAFAALAFCARLAAEGSRWPVPAWQALVLAWGVLIELAQTQVPGRHGEWPDLLADAVGMGIGATAAWLVLRWPRLARMNDAA